MKRLTLLCFVAGLVVGCVSIEPEAVVSLDQLHGSWTATWEDDDQLVGPVDVGLGLRVDAWTGTIDYRNDRQDSECLRSERWRCDADVPTDGTLLLEDCDREVQHRLPSGVTQEDLSPLERVAWDSVQLDEDILILGEFVLERGELE